MALFAICKEEEEAPPKTGTLGITTSSNSRQRADVRCAMHDVAALLSPFLRFVPSHVGRNSVKCNQICKSPQRVRFAHCKVQHGFI